MSKTNTRRKNLLLFCAALVSSSFLFVSPIETTAGGYRYTPPKKYTPAPNTKPDPASVYIPIEEFSSETIFGYQKVEKFGLPYILKVDDQYWICAAKNIAKEMRERGIRLFCVAPNAINRKVKLVFLPRKDSLIDNRWASVGFEGALNCRIKEIKPGPLLFSTEPFLKSVTKKLDVHGSDQWNYGLEGTPMDFAILLGCLQ